MSILKEYLNKYICTKMYSVIKSMEKIEANGKGILFVVDSEGKLVGSISDGDIRRWILGGNSVESDIKDAMNSNPVFISRQNIGVEYRVMREKSISAIPIVDSQNRVVDIAFFNEAISQQKPVYIIAEAGVNHNGNFETACKMVDVAKEAGADCIKFQTFCAEKLASQFAKKAEYQQRCTNDGTQQDLLKRLELSHDEFIKLKQYCDQVGIAFASTPFEEDSLSFLQTIDMPFWKIPSGEVTNLPLLVKVGKTGKPVILSTGMSSMQEVRDAINILQNNGTPNITVLHCNTEYPTPLEDVNLRAMNTLRDELGVEVGYSDHTLGIEVPIAAAAMGASVIEKHFTLDRGMEGPDHKASLDPDDLKQMISCIRDIETVLGSGVKIASPSEIKNMDIARKSIVAKKRIKAGEILTEENITTKRPGNGINPMRWYDVLGTKASRDFEIDELIE